MPSFTLLSFLSSSLFSPLSSQKGNLCTLLVYSLYVCTFHLLLHQLCYLLFCPSLFHLSSTFLSLHLLDYQNNLFVHLNFFHKTIQGKRIENKKRNEKEGSVECTIMSSNIGGRPTEIIDQAASAQTNNHCEGS